MNVKSTVWIDLDNTPHVPFFHPILDELQRRGHQVVLTARDAFQTCELASQHGFTYVRIGRHSGRSKWLKAWGLVVRALSLVPFVLREKPRLGLSHGSRAQIMLCNLLRIPTVELSDYEHVAALPFLRADWLIVPEVMQRQAPYLPRKRPLLTYQGIKEDVYVPAFTPDPSIRTCLGLERDNIIVTVRPPATEAHYHNSESEKLFTAFMERASNAPGVKVVLLPRNQRQAEKIRAGWPRWFDGSRVVIPDQAVDGLNLLWHSDLVVSGGGTMNREAAAMGIPVFSIFRGTIGAVDRQLQAEGRMTLIETPAEIESKIPLQRRVRSTSERFAARPALADIVNHVEAILKSTT